MNKGTISTGSTSRQRDFFVILEEFFERATGKRIHDFATLDTFDEEIRKNPTGLARKAEGALRYAWETLPSFYEQGKSQDFAGAAASAGLKFVIGGSSRFEKTHFDSVRKMLLYADTILIPDPILPWMETAREEERFRDVLFIKAAFTLLHLKPLVDAQLPYPAVLVFPSYEKSLESRDPKTLAFIHKFLVEILSARLGADFGSLAEIATFATQESEEFLTRVESKGLFLGPGGEPGQSLARQINEYRAFISQWRSEAEQKRAATCSDGRLVFQGLAERLVPQFHLLENAEEMGANPMLCIPNQLHYYNLCTTAFEERLQKFGLLETKTIASMRAINQPHLSWLGNIPVDSLVRLRQKNENASFRKRLADLSAQLHQATFGDIDKVTAEFSKEISSLLAEHSAAVAQQAGEFQRKYKNILIGAAATLAAVLVPSLAPFGIPSVAGVALSYAKTKTEEIQKSKHHLKSLVGVLAAAKEEEGGC